jgi:hypothetical protein
MSLASRRPGASGGVTAEEAFEVLANQRRRLVVRTLSTERELRLRGLSRRVAARENNKPPERVTAEERRRVYNALQQFHLPKLDDAGVVDYDARRGVIAATDRLGGLRAYLAAPCRRRPRVGLLLGSTVLGLLAGLVVASVPLAGLAGPGVAVAAPLAFVVGLTAVGVVAGHSRGDGDRGSER